MELGACTHRCGPHGWCGPEPWPRHLDTKPRHQLDTNSTPRHPMPTRPTRHPSTPLDTPRHHLGWYHARPCQGAKLDTSTPLDTARHRSTPLDNRSTPLDTSDDLTQQRRRPIWSHRVRKSGLQQQYLAGSTFIPQLQPLKSSRSSCGSVAPLLM